MVVTAAPAAPARRRDAPAWEICAWGPSLSSPPAGDDERLDLARLDADRVGAPGVPDLPAFAQRVDCGGAHPQTPGDIAGRQQPLPLGARGQGRDKLLGIRWYDMGTLDS